MSASQPHSSHQTPHQSAPRAVPSAVPNQHKQPAVKPEPKPHYGQRAVWRCQNNISGRIHTIHGPLAQILNRYPNDYHLTFLGTERTSNRWFK